MDKLLTAIVVVGLVGLFFLGKGITGYAVAETCCFPPDCPPENICDIAEDMESGPLQPVSDLYVGSVLVIGAVAAFAALTKRRALRI